MKFNFILEALCATALVSQASAADLDASGVGQFLGGVLTGAMSMEDKEDFVTCAEYGGRAAPYIDEAMLNIGLKTEESVPLGFAQLEVHVRRLINVIEECTETEDKTVLEHLGFQLDFLRDEEMTFTPESADGSVSESLIFNEIDIIEDVDQAITKYALGEFEKAGELIGDAIERCYNTTDGEEMLAIDENFSYNMTINTLDTVAGLLTGMFKDDVKEQVFSCITDVHTVYKDLMMAAANFDKQTAMALYEAFNDLTSVFKDIIAQMEHCETLKVTGNKLMDVMLEMKAPSTFVSKISSNFSLNGINVYFDVMAGVESWKKNEYYDFGLNLGNALARVFVTEEEKEETK